MENKFYLVIFIILIIILTTNRLTPRRIEKLSTAEPTVLPPSDSTRLAEPINQRELVFLRTYGLMPEGKFSYEKFTELYNQNRDQLDADAIKFIRANNLIQRLEAQDLKEKEITNQSALDLMANQKPDQVVNKPAQVNRNLCFCSGNQPSGQSCVHDGQNCFEFAKYLKGRNTLNQEGLDAISKFYCDWLGNYSHALSQMGAEVQGDKNGLPFYYNCHLKKARYYPSGFGKAMEDITKEEIEKIPKMTIL